MLAERVVEWTRDWKQQGIEEGRQEGRKEGEEALLMRQLELRFGPLDKSIRRRVQEANAETLLCWGERILTAATAEDVVGE